MSSSSTAVPFRSHLTTLMTNYFDEKDVRVRRGRYTVDAQLLNAAARGIEMAGLRISREIGAATLHSVPSNIDHGGWYWKQRLPDVIDLEAPTHTVEGTIEGVVYEFVQYDDQLPVPVGHFPKDTSFTPIPMTTPLLFELSGIGNTITQSWSAQRVGAITPPLPDRVHFWVDGPGYYGLDISVRIIGQRAPMPAWADALSTSSESITLTNLGWARSKFAWARIDQIQVLNLPVGVTLSGYSGTFGLPMQPDPNRPYTDPLYRDVLFDRYWSSAEGFLTEKWLESNYAGWRYANSQQTFEDAFSGMAVEPNTWGMFAAAGTTLYYFDRREMLPPVGLSAPAISREPYYGLEVYVDETNLTPVRFVVIEPIPYGRSSSAGSYRYLVTTPDNVTYVLTPNGFFAEYSRNAGWRSGVPPTITIPLPITGTYIFYIQAIGPDGVIVQDGTPYQNGAFTPLATLDMSDVVSDIKGLAFDDSGRLLVWDGATIIPVQFHYNAYLIDPGTQAIYLTDYVDALTVDGVEIGASSSSGGNIYVNGVLVGTYSGTITVGGISI